ncbi:ubiquitin conjugating protein, putative [Trichomonas vaginalis G3]|uniref:Ubiquitin conjugating protein, putative n=1 Tax=Trichomonas vaginalis (strain ATCC PRA-98 / G3) TaxID=412133 RepID=A2F2A5_TRIV3|nr:histone ubiquitination [Trichomonas vaginalis G3]EAY00984.1 ubiquitin conjugating protein, putative [Trichomonas vaginalis G3]KAI5516790.1 histone ubiquitination [Trichomonas vaginalis G3]|eukprot:XP_001330055.1 ubiquitin conjugating protein [Trichomonas vaginalis G3]
MSEAVRKLIKYYKQLKKDIDNGSIDGLIAQPMKDNVLHWTAVIFGPQGTDWADGIFELEMVFKDDFPRSAPEVKFITPVYHPNVYRDGKICLDMLQNKWTPAYDISAILNSIRSLFDDPNPASPANGEAAEAFQNNRPKYNEKVQQCVRESIRLWKEKHPNN